MSLSLFLRRPLNPDGNLSLLRLKLKGEVFFSLPDKIQLIGIKFSRSVILQGTFTPRKPIDSSVKEPPSHVRKIIDATSKIGLMKKKIGKNCQISHAVLSKHFDQRTNLIIFALSMPIRIEPEYIYDWMLLNANFVVRTSLK